MATIKETSRLACANLHGHNILPSSGDASCYPPEVAEKCLEANIHFLAATNHNTTEGADEIADSFASLGCNVLILGYKENRAISIRNDGTEITIVKGEELKLKLRNKVGTYTEMLAYFLDEPISPNLSLEEALREIEKQKAIVGIPHPFDIKRHGLGAEIGEEAIRRAHELGIPVTWEVFNARANNEQNRKSKDFYKEWREKHPDIPLLASAGSDAHHSSEYKRSKIRLLPFHDKPGFLKSMQCVDVDKDIVGDDNSIRSNYWYRPLNIATRISRRK